MTDVIDNHFDLCGNGREMKMKRNLKFYRYQDAFCNRELSFLLKRKSAKNIYQHLVSVCEREIYMKIIKVISKIIY